MATNPMQRKARISFLLGMLLAVIILGAVIAFLFLQLTNMKKEQDAQKQAMVKVYALKQNVSSGQVITSDMLEELNVDKNTVPSNAINLTVFQNYALQDEAGHTITTRYEDDVPKMYITLDDEQQENTNENENENENENNTNNNRNNNDDNTFEVFQEGNAYYIERNNEREYLTLSEVPLVAKVNMSANTVLTTSLIAKSDNVTQNDTRKVEYNMFILPTDLTTGDFVDIRLMLPSGTDYIVVAKKEVEIPLISGIDATDTISVNLNEDEIDMLSNAIVEAFKVNGAKLYVSKYTEPGLQEPAEPTYPVNQEVMQLINSNPNIVETARDALWNRYNIEQRNSVINPAVGNEDAQDNYEENMEESITNAITRRQEYLEGLGTTVSTNSGSSSSNSTSSNTTSN